MRSARLKLSSLHPVAYYHCISRVVDRTFRLGEREKAVFIDFMRRYEMFCGVRILTFCIMSNHFHILVEVPRRPEVGDLPSDADLVERVKQCQGIKPAELLREQLADALAEAREEHGQQDLSTVVLEDASRAAYFLRRHRDLREHWLCRMWDVSTFMQGLKRRFSSWYNRENGRKGTLWEERFKSVLVQGGYALATVAAYIDLNPVRAEIVKDPADYRWSGYGEVCHGVVLSRRALGALVEFMRVPGIQSLKDAMRWYRVYIYEAGLERGLGPNDKPMKAGFTREQVERVKSQQGALPAVAQLMRRVRYFSDGMVMGTRAFVDEVFQEKRERFSEKRKSGARPMGPSEAWAELRVMRDLRKV